MRNLLATLLMAQICSGTPLIDWDFSQAEKFPHQKELDGATLLSSQHAITDNSISVSPLTAGGSLVSSTYQSVANTLNVARFARQGNPGYLEFTLHNQSAGEINLDSIHIEAMPNGPNAPKALRVTISCDGTGFQELASEQAFPVFDKKMFSSLLFTQTTSFKKLAVIRVQSASTKQSTGNLHIRKLTVHHVASPNSEKKTAPTRVAQSRRSVSSALISFAGISLQLQ